MRWAEYVARMGEDKQVYKVLVRKPEGKRHLGRPRRRWEDVIRMDLREIGWGSLQWIQLAQDRDRWRALVNTVMNLRILAPRNYSQAVPLEQTHFAAGTDSSLWPRDQGQHRIPGARQLASLSHVAASGTGPG
jgi:hypothetical protein